MQIPKFVRYLISGGIAALLNLGVFSFAIDVLGIRYAVSAIFAFIASFVSSYVLQRSWTFRDTRSRSIRGELSLYLLVALANILVNEALLFAFIELIHLHHLLAQLISLGIIALESYFVYRFFIFAPKRR